MRINSNAMFFGRASIGMKKGTNSVAVATLLLRQIQISGYGNLRYYGT